MVHCKILSPVTIAAKIYILPFYFYKYSVLSNDYMDSLNIPTRSNTRRDTSDQRSVRPLNVRAIIIQQ